MNGSDIYFSPQLLTNVFPFCLVISSDGRLIHIGNSIQRICSELKPGSLFNDFFDIQSPEASINFESIQLYLQSLFILKDRKKSLILKGQMIYIAENNILLFLGNPYFPDLTALADMGLILNDFSIHYPISDYLALLQSQKVALSDVQRLTHQLEQQRKDTHTNLDREKELNDLRGRFITTASHGFRTPLGIIASSTGILQDYSHQISESMREKHLDRIQAAVSRITELLDDVLTISYIETGRLKVNPQTLNLLEVCQEFIQEVLENSSCILNFAMDSELTDRMIDLDKSLLRQILVNLLSNAVKYSPASGEVKFNVQYRDRQIAFIIQDSGIGIPPEDLPSIFDPFHRAKNVGSIVGTGLGLAIAKHCTDLLHGRIESMSDMGVGTTMTVTIPVEEASNFSESNLKQQSSTQIN